MKRFVISMLVPTLFACGSAKEADKIGDAQACLDTITAASAPADVNACVEKIDGITTSGAQNIRCAAGFMKEGFASGQRFLDAFAAIDAGTTSTSTQSLMGILTFTATGALATDAADTTSTFNTCIDSTSKGSTLLASFSSITMSLVTYFNAKNSGSCSGTPTTVTAGYKIYDVAACISGANPLTAVLPLVTSASIDAQAITAQTSIGSAIIKTYNLSCTGSGANKDLCQLFSDAITGTSGGSSNPRGVAVTFFQSALNIH